MHTDTEHSEKGNTTRKQSGTAGAYGTNEKARNSKEADAKARVKASIDDNLREAEEDLGGEDLPDERACSGGRKRAAHEVEV